MGYVHTISHLPRVIIAILFIGIYSYEPRAKGNRDFHLKQGTGNILTSKPGAEEKRQKQGGERHEISLRESKTKAKTKIKAEH